MDAEAMHILRDELPNVDITVSSQTSPELAEGLTRGKLDLAFLRPEPNMPALEYKVVMQPAKRSTVSILPRFPC